MVEVCEPAFCDGQVVSGEGLKATLSGPSLPFVSMPAYAPVVSRQRAEGGERPVLLANFGLDEASDVDGFEFRQQYTLELYL